MVARIAFGMALVVALTGIVRAQDKPLERSEIDKRAAKAAYEAALAGTEIFNGGDHSGCARLYQGTLQALLPMLDHRPKLAASVAEKLQTAKTLRAPQAATVLREALDEIMGQSKAAATLWDRLGGEKVVRVLVKEAGTAAASDPKVNFSRGGQYKLDEKAVERMEQLLVEFVSINAGGPLKYSGRDLATVHKGMKITDAEFDVLMEHLKATLKKHSIGPRETDELVALVEKTRKQIVEEPKK
jgi:hemoglobin